MSFGTQAMAMSKMCRCKWFALVVVAGIALALVTQPVAAKAAFSNVTAASPQSDSSLSETELATAMALVGWGELLTEDEMKSISGGVSPVLVGAGLGALSSGVSYGLNALRTGTWDWGDFASNVGSGALGGAAAGLIPGSSALSETARTIGAAVVGTVSSWFADWFGW
ncbi:MAG: hypothetical protein IMX00_04890 [Limnochordales bacterium]|nr:hypothetical protein [Limnochordales bacterium]